MLSHCPLLNSLSETCTRAFNKLARAASKQKYARILAKLGKGLAALLEKPPLLATDHLDVDKAQSAACQWFMKLIEGVFFRHLDGDNALKEIKVRYVIASVVVSTLGSDNLTPNRVSGVLAGLIYGIRLIALLSFNMYLEGVGKNESQ